MDFGYALLQMYPNVKPSEYEITQMGDGSFKITRWDPTDTAQPAESDVEAYWTSTVELKKAMDLKKQELQFKCAEVIQSGFTSSALGTVHTYPSDPTSMIYFTATYNRFNYDPSFTTVDWATVDAGYLTHTKDQFMTAFHDGHDFGIQQEQHLKQLIADVLAAKDVPTVQAITW